MTTRQKLGLTLTLASLFAAMLLQIKFACLYSPEAIHDIHIVPAPADLTPILFILAINWVIVLPLLTTFVLGVLCLFIPSRQMFDEPQWVEIKYLH